MTFSRFVVTVLATLVAAGMSCDQKSGPSAATVVLYTSIDQPVAEQIVDAFRQSTGIDVRVVTDTEATKSIGLAERLRAEKINPVAHVWWGNEVFHTIALADEGHFAELSGTDLSRTDSKYIDPRRRWAGNGLRVRTLAVGEQTGALKASIRTMLDPRFKNRIVMARPTAGTTAGHVAALYVAWGDATADDFFRRLRDNGVVMVGGNSVAASGVGSGQFDIGLTDNDDVFAAQRAGGELWGLIPDQGDTDIGTLAIPTTVAVVRRADLPAEANRLADYLLSESVERKLISIQFCQFGVRNDPAVKTMNLSFSDVAARMAVSAKRAVAILEGQAN
jgi:iron(III) transport system substrate-binding protein